MEAKQWVNRKVEIGRNHDPPNRGLFEIGVQRSGDDGLLNFAERYLAKWSGGLDLFKCNGAIEGRRRRLCETFEHTFALAGDFLSFAIEPHGSRIDGNAQVRGIGGGESKVIIINRQACPSQEDMVTPAPIALPKSKRALRIEDNNLDKPPVGGANCCGDLRARG